MKTHDLKVHSKFWQDLSTSRNTNAVRRDDRGYHVGDVLWLREYNPAFGYTGMTCMRRVTHILRNEDMPQGVAKGWCVMSLAAVLP